MVCVNLNWKHEQHNLLIFIKILNKSRLTVYKFTYVMSRVNILRMYQEGIVQKLWFLCLYTNVYTIVKFSSIVSPWCRLLSPFLDSSVPSAKRESSVCYHQIYKAIYICSFRRVYEAFDGCLSF